MLRQAIAFNKNGDYQEAINHYTVLLFFEPENILAYYNRGLAYLITDQYDNAISDFDTALYIKNDLLDARLGLIEAIDAKDDEALMPESPYQKQQNCKHSPFYLSILEK